MVPHAQFVSSDRYFDLALQLLTLVVGGALVASLATLLLIGLRPAPASADRGDVGPPFLAAMSDVLRTPHRIELPLPQLPLIYRCQHRDEVIYTDRPCLAGQVRTLSLRPS